MAGKSVTILGRLLPPSGKVHQNQEVYMSAEDESLICTLKATDYKNPPKILVEVINDK